MSLTQTAHRILAEHFLSRLDKQPSLIAVDATCGNGHDTLFLLKLGFAHVYAFDVQELAVTATTKRCAGYPKSQLSVIHASHADLRNYVPANIDSALFNLGYLPGADQTLTTQATSSLEALKQAVAILNSGGMISVICYPGHAGGADETDTITQHLSLLASSDLFTLTRYDSAQSNTTTPVLFILEKH